MGEAVSPLSHFNSFNPTYLMDITTYTKPQLHIALNASQQAVKCLQRCIDNPLARKLEESAKWPVEMLQLLKKQQEIENAIDTNQPTLDN